MTQGLGGFLLLLGGGGGAVVKVLAVCQVLVLGSDEFVFVNK